MSLREKLENLQYGDVIFFTRNLEVIGEYSDYLVVERVKDGIILGELVSSCEVNLSSIDRLLIVPHGVNKISIGKFLGCLVGYIQKVKFEDRKIKFEDF